MTSIDLINHYHVSFHILKQRELGWITSDEHLEGVINMYDHGVYYVTSNDGRKFEITICDIFSIW